MGGSFFLILEQQIEQQQKNTKIKYNKGLRWPPYNILHATSNKKQAGMTEGGRDRPRNHARTLRERDGNNKPLAEGNYNNNDDEE
jgi:hypothetical protein